ncbi:MAG: AsmA family protein [Verrucomicrobiota bacterium]
MKALKVILIICVVLAVIAGAGLFMLTRFLERPEFRQKLVGLASQATGTAVEITDLKVSIFSGIELQGVAIGNPGGFTGNLLTAKAFTLRYRLWPLLQKRVKVATVVLDSPVITLAKNAKGEWNYDKIGSKTEKVKSTGPAAAPSTSAGGLDISLQNIEMKNATVVMVKDDGKELLRVKGASFASAINLAGGQMSGTGNARLELVNAANSLILRNIATPVELTPAAVKLAPLTGTLAGGDITGDAGLSLAGDAKYTVNLHVKNADVVTLIKEAGVAQQVFSGGKLQMKAALTGTGGLETINGAGNAEVVGGQLVNIPLLNLVATLLQVPALQDLKFDEIKLEYTIANNVMQTPVIRLKSPQVQITGKGTVALTDYALDHTFTLTLAAGVLDHAPKEIRQEFTAVTNGAYAIDFKVWGPYDAPKTDLQKRLLKGVADQLLKKFLK